MNRVLHIEEDLPDFAAAVLDVVDRVPAGRVTTYADLARFLGSGGPRQVGAVMARFGGMVTWWRVVNAAGRLPPRLLAGGLARWRQEGTPVRLGVPPAVDLGRARVSLSQLGGIVGPE